MSGIGMSEPRRSTGRSADGRLKVGFVLARAFTLSAFSMFVDTLRLSADEADRSRRIHADWEVMATNALLIASSCGVKLAPTARLLDPVLFDYIVAVGGLLTEQSPVDAETVAYLKKADAKGVPLIGLCTGTFILADAGLMRKHQTCVSWLCHDAFRERFPDHPVRSDRLFNLDRTRGSCAGGSSAADIAAAIVRRHISPAAEKNAMEILQIQKARTRSDVQTRKPLSIECDDPRLRAALIIMENNIDGSKTTSELAGAVGLSRRQLERLFIAKANGSPGQIYKRLRLERSRQLLVASKAPLIEIALDVGFESAANFSRQFKHAYGMSPSRFRQGGR